MNSTPFIFRDTPSPCPPPGEPVEWMAGGSCLPGAFAAYGFDEEQVVGAAIDAYQETFMDAPSGVGREELRAVMVGRFVDMLDALGA